MLADFAPTKMQTTIFTVIHALLILAIQMSGLNVNIVISFDGAIVGFFVVYFIPIALHFKLLFTKNDPLLLNR